MKYLLTYKLFEQNSLLEFLGEDRWPSDWKEMPEWKSLEKLGFYDATTPLQAKNKTITIKNSDPKLSHFYPGGIVLQQSGYIRDKGQRSGFIKRFKTDYTLKDLLDHVIKSASKEFSRTTSGAEKGDLTQSQINLINRSTRAKWKYNKVTGEVDVSGVVTILIRNKDDEKALNSMKFGRVRDFNLHGFQNPVMNFLPSRIDGQLYFQGCGLKNLKQVTSRPKELFLGKCEDLESLEGLGPLLPLKMFSLGRISVEPGTPEKMFQLIEKEFTWESSGGVSYSYFGDDQQREKKRATDLFLSGLSAEQLAPYFRKDPLKIYILDEYPDLKREVLKLTGLRDLSKLGKSLGMII